MAVTKGTKSKIFYMNYLYKSTWRTTLGCAPHLSKVSCGKKLRLRIKLVHKRQRNQFSPFHFAGHASHELCRRASASNSLFP